MIVATAPESCQNCDFFLKKRMKEIFASILELMLPLAKCKITVIVYLAVKKGQYFTFENIHRGLLSLINPAVYLRNTILWVE